MGIKGGLLEEPFDAALINWKELVVKFLKYCAKDPMPAEAPRTSEELILRSREVYRQHRALADAAIRGAANFLANPDGALHVKTLKTSLEEYRSTAIGREIGKRIYEAPEFAPMREELKSSSLAVGVGFSGSAWALIGGYFGVEHIYNDPEATLRAWYALELELVAGIDVGLSLSFWTNQAPLDGCIMGFELDLAVEIPLTNPAYPFFPFALKFVPIWQRPQFSAKWEFAGFAIQLPLGLIYPRIGGMYGVAAGVFLAHQKAEERKPRASLSVLDADGTSTITVATPTTLTFTITFNTTESFDAAAQIVYTMPNSFSTTDISAFEVANPPTGWDFSVSDDDSGLVLTAKSALTYDATQTISFTTNAVQASGKVNTGDIEKGYVRAKLTTTDRFAVQTAAPLDVAWETFKASLDWNASVGTDPDYVMSFTTSTCSSTSECSGEDTPAYSQNSKTPQCLAQATDSEGNLWCFGYQYNYTDTGSADNTGELRAAIWREDLPAATASTGKYVQPGGSTMQTSTTLGSSADGPTITITVTFD